MCTLAVRASGVKARYANQGKLGGQGSRLEPPPPRKTTPVVPFFEGVEASTGTLSGF